MHITFVIVNIQYSDQKRSDTLTDLFLILRFEICTKIYNEKEVLLNLRLQQRKLRYFLKSLTIQRANIVYEITLLHIVRHYLF